MADDTRQPDASPTDENPQSDARPFTRPKPKHDFPKTQAGKMWEMLGNPAEPANTLPGGTYNSAGGKPPEVTWRDAFNFSYGGKGPSWYQVPCARDALLVGIASGGAVGGARFILRGLSSMLITTNLAVAGFALSASGMYYWCDQRRREEARGMALAVQGMRMLHEKKAREKAAEEAARAAAAAAVEEQERKRRAHWYKFW
ncbi:uncharacterized protein Z520_09697 [Fonsecaea multimorphosa CBS 102226]|uniref:Cytochrome c oxidase assembly protein COX20, mitochondrial n=1 Tax=Fonsecaea multimorphosa CBS 102226 TaxID=1442371 RepID=A0A0D2IBX9_9EURO|nr:uncharacterized protein Z520_09697 [Fonsecaea multimorphosa CBS 102226]KIX94651.1 hypothetical protein Z520_09697 [Fonsecaea multimorphosa CBS 102226]OAL20223.1 hypothetical protein AYO22_09070 [Fonsecaea multimorphosa]